MTFAEPLTSLLGAVGNQTPIFLRKAGAVDVVLRAYLWECGPVEYDAGGAVDGPSRHRLVSPSITFSAAVDTIGIAEGDLVIQAGMQHSVLDVVTDGIQTTLTLSRGVAV